MDPGFRTVAIAAASLGLLVSLFFALRPSGDDATATTTTTATAVPTPPPETSTGPTITSPTGTNTPAPIPTPSDVETIRIAVRSDSAGHVQRFSVKRGRKVELVVTSELADEVHVHGYDLMADVAPGEPATIRFTANAPGGFEIELEGRGLPIAELEVRP